MTSTPTETGRWYEGITRYQWTVLIIASLGWVFDVFEGQIFVASMREAMPSLVPEETSKGQIDRYIHISLGAFLLGGALGGIFFGMLSDRIGRKRTLTLTILFYSLFTCVSAFAQQWWHLAGMRFLVALGVGGEWAVASALVFEVFPQRARAHVGSIFHASSVFGTYLAVAAGTFLIGNSAVRAWAVSERMDWISDFIDPASLPWRMGFLLGALPALLIIWLRVSLREPQRWTAARDRAAQEPFRRLGTVDDLFSAEHRRTTAVCVVLAAVGLATFWGTHIYGKDMLLDARRREFNEADAAIQPSLTEAQQAALDHERQPMLKRWEMLGMFLVTTGGGIGLVSFGPICQRIGRRGTFLIFYAGGFVSALVVFLVIKDVTTLLFALPVFGFLTLGMHAGFAIYFPELYPTRLRSTGTGFCFNAGRVLAAPVLVFVSPGAETFSLPEYASVISGLYLVGCLALVYAPETKGREVAD